MSLDSRMDRLAADQQLDAACQAITASVAMLRATELQVREIQDRQGYSPEEATHLCEQVAALLTLATPTLTPTPTPTPNARVGAHGKGLRPWEARAGLAAEEMLAA